MQFLPENAGPVDPEAFNNSESTAQWIMNLFAAANVQAGDGLYYPQLLWACVDAGGRPFALQSGLRLLFDRGLVTGHSHHSLKIYLTMPGWRATRDEPDDGCPA